jgi:hypothetical protein
LVKDGGAMKYNRLLPLIVPLVCLFLLEVYFFQHQLIYVSVILILLLLFFSIRQFLIAGNSSEAWYNYYITPALLSFSLIAFTTMLPSGWSVQLCLLGVVVLLYFYLRLLYIYLVNFNLRERESLENFSAYGNFLAFYFLASFLYGIRSFLNFSVWPLMLIFLAATVLIIYEIFWVNKINLKASSFYILLLSLVLTELAWALTFLTLSFYILGLIITINYYILIGLTKFYLKGELDKKIIKLYLTFGFASILIVLLSARWFET